jgi:tetratricopeptide (TPR) repeat protein
MTKVFLSYVREDLGTARKIAASLERAGHSVWWDRHIRGGAEFAAEIDRALDDAQAVVALWSHRSVKSAWVRDEAGAGRDTGRLIPMRIDECIPPLGFRQYQSIDLLGGKNAHQAALQELNQALQALAGDGSRSLPLPARDEPAGSLTRRGLVASAGAAAVAAAAGGGLLLYRRKSRPRVPPEVQPLLLQAKQLMNQNTREGQYQGIALYQRVTQIAPNYADGWGWLGYAYGVISHYRERGESLAARARAQAAGRRALELDPDSAMGEVALSVALPFIGHWEERERRLVHALELDPDNDEILVIRAVALIFAGRASEAVPFYLRIKHKPLTPAEYTNFISALWCAGRLPELDQAIKDSASLYPTQASLWYTRLNIATFNGETNAVAALTDDVQGRPTGITDEDATDFKRLAQAIRDRDTAEADAIMRQQMIGARGSANQADETIRIASALGRLDDAFTVANAYYFGRGFAIPDLRANPNSFSPEQRQTRFLFEPATRPMRADPRFEPLVKELGFDRYWRQSGKPPDYRHIPGL